MDDVSITRKLFRKDRGRWTFYCKCCGKKVVSTDTAEYFDCLVFYSEMEALGSRTCSEGCTEVEVVRLRTYIAENRADLVSGRSVIVR